MLQWSDYIQMFTAILVVVNPLGAIPVFISLTTGQSPQDRKITAYITALSVAIVLILASVLGESILRFFGISIASFRIGGGILLLLMAIAMFHAQQTSAKHTPEEAQEGEEKENVSVVPLAIPILSGPGAITTVIIYAYKVTRWIDYAFLIGCCVITALIVWLALRLGVPTAKMLGKTGINIITRIMGLLLAAIAVEFITNGLMETFAVVK
jgi:multiple antibiotic resistance protein